jgi:hypothetical protein
MSLNVPRLSCEQNTQLARNPESKAGKTKGAQEMGAPFHREMVSTRVSAQFESKSITLIGSVMDSLAPTA